MKQSILTLVLCCGLVMALHAQDPVFSQFYASPLQLNPAFAGTTYAPRIALNYRNQYPEFNNAYVTYALSYDQFFSGANSGIGVSLLTDAAGDGLYTTNRLGLVYAYRLQATEELYIKMGAEMGIFNSNVDFNRLVFPDQLNPLTGAVDELGNPNPTGEVLPDNANTTYADISVGFLAYTDQYYGGLTIKHLNTPDDSFLQTNDNTNEGLPMRLSIHGGASFEFETPGRKTPDFFFSPNIVYMQQGEFAQVNVSAIGGYGVMRAGMAYRHTFTNQDALIGIVGVGWDIYSLGYSYDFTLSELGADTGGTHEISLILNFDRNRKRGPDYNDCFQLFR